jgi:GcrA cell cycle regulator
LSTWSNEDTATLVKLWGEGHSAGLIARHIGGTTRNAVIGKVHRLGLPGRNTTSRTIARGGRRRRRFKIAAGQAAHTTPPKQELAARLQIALERAAVQAQPDLFIPPEERQPILVHDSRGRLPANERLIESSCRWTFGDGSKGDPYYCCGRSKVPGLPYCEFHARRAFNPVQPEHRRWPSRQGYVRHVADIQTLETLEPA